MAVPHTNRVLSHLFDIRNIIGALLAIYGVVLTVAGFAPAILRDHDDPAAARNRSDLYVGTEANWWVGLILLAVAAGFIVWALVRPLKADEVAATDTVE
jgi:H+/Cl- antiporter ClcA